MAALEPPHGSSAPGCEERHETRWTNGLRGWSAMSRGKSRSGRSAMSAWRSESAVPHTPVRLIDIHDLPVFLIDIELSMPPPGLGNDRAVVLLCHGEGPPAAVLKVARGLSGAMELRVQRRVLAELAIHQALDDQWRELLPRILAFDERTNVTVSVESYQPGMDLADVLARRPSRVEELTVAALSAIAPLHRRTATFSVFDNACLLRRWILESLRGLMDMCRRIDPGLVPEVERLGTTLRQAVVGRPMPVGWTHGDYTPGNIRVAGVQGPVTGIVDWGGARPGRPALIDEYLMILTASSQVEHVDLGTVVAARLRAGGLSDSERSALRAARSGGADGDADEPVDEHIAILLTWLHRTADSWRKRAILPNHHVWWATTVAPVLDAVAPLQGFDVSKRGSDTGDAAIDPSPPGMSERSDTQKVRRLSE
jgi:phosphotransferase family enzyme